MTVASRVRCDLFIRSYWKDLEWLSLCLASIARYCRGFGETIVVLPRASEPWLRRVTLPHARIELCRNYRDDYLGQQATKLHADTFSDAEYICHVDSDCVIFRPTTPDDLIRGGRPCVRTRPCELLGRERPWQRPTEAFLGWPVELDFMQHPPFTRWLYPCVRDHAHSVHGADLERYLEAQPPRGFSEFNVLGALAWRHHRDRFTWIDATTAALDPPCRWYWSWGGLDGATRAEIAEILGG